MPDEPFEANEASEPAEQIEPAGPIAPSLETTGVSVIVITLDEEHVIADCLESVRWADEIVVLDCGSSDRTV